MTPPIKTDSERSEAVKSFRKRAGRAQVQPKASIIRIWAKYFENQVPGMIGCGLLNKKQVRALALWHARDSLMPERFSSFCERMAARRQALGVVNRRTKKGPGA